MTERVEIGKQEEFVRLDWRLTGKGEIPCKVFNDMFETIKVIEITVEDQIVIFSDVDNSFVEIDEPVNIEKGVKGWVRVTVKEEKENSLVVKLPGEPLSTRDIIEVPKEMVRGIKVTKNLIHQA